MNRTLKDLLGLSISMWVVFFISNLINPDAKNKDQIAADFIGIAYCIGRRPEQRCNCAPGDCVIDASKRQNCMLKHPGPGTIAKAKLQNTLST